jgi:hypothetical protein
MDASPSLRVSGWMGTSWPHQPVTDGGGESFDAVERAPAATFLLAERNFRGSDSYL